jgi:transposase InsO family protein
MRLKAFPLSFQFLYVLTDNGSEFKKHFSERLKELHLTRYRAYPKTPKMNAHMERFNHAMQDDWVDWHLYELLEPDVFNRSLIDYLIFYNTERVHYAFQNKLTPIQFMIQRQTQQPSYILNQSACARRSDRPQESKNGWRYAASCKLGKI